jgi:hypothetical protein
LAKSTRKADISLPKPRPVISMIPFRAGLWD